MKKLFLFLITCTSAFCLSAQPLIEWQKCLGGTSVEQPRSIQQTNEGGYIVAGYSQSNDGDVTGNHGMIDYWIVKLNNTGAIQWQKSLGGTQIDEATSIQQTSDSGYIVAGVTFSNDSDVTGFQGGDDFWIVKLNSTGDIQWEKCLGGTEFEYAASIQQTTDSGYIVAGNSSSNDSDVTGNHGGNDCWIVKLNGTGTIQWQKCLGGTQFDMASSIQQTTDSGFVVAGVSTSNDGNVSGHHGDSLTEDYWVVKLDSTGAIEWQKSLGGTGNEWAFSIRQTTDNGYILAGNSNSNDGDVTGNHGGTDFWIVKLNGIGTILWQKCLGGTGVDMASSIQQTTDSGYIVVGNSTSTDGDVTGNHNSIDYWVVKLNKTGIIQGQKSLGGTGYDWPYSIQQTTDGGYITAGFSSSNDGDVTGNHGGNDCWVVKLSAGIGIVEIKNPLSNLQLIPNPISKSTNISFSLNQSENISVNVYDFTGRFIQNIFDGNLSRGEHQIKWSVNNAIKDGVYFLNLSSESFSQSFKLVVVE